MIMQITDVYSNIFCFHGFNKHVKRDSQMFRERERDMYFLWEREKEKEREDLRQIQLMFARSRFERSVVLIVLHITS